MTSVNTDGAFEFNAPLSVYLDKSKPDGQQRRIGGVISTESKDREDEVILQRGLDFSEWLSSGFFNNNHGKGITDVLGEPDPTALKFVRKGDKLPNGTTATSNAHWAEGWLYEGDPHADAVWAKAQAMQKSPGTRRRLGFSIEGAIQKRMGADNKIIAKAKVRHVAVTHCFTGDVRVSGVAEKVMRRRYSGPMIELHLATGEKLTGTPNHPIFTQRGWVPLGELDERCDRVGRFDRDLVASASISHDIDHMPASFQEVFDLSLLSSETKWISPAREVQFHGDGLGGDVDVVLADGFLRDRLHTAFTQKFGKEALAASDKQASRFANSRQALEMAGAVFGSASRGVGGDSQRLALGGGASGVSKQLVFVPGAGDARSLRGVEDRLARHTVTGGDRGRALSSAIGFSQISLKRVFDFCGHVFNLETTHGWYEANGIVAHNCPVNTDTSLHVLAKSLHKAESEPFNVPSARSLEEAAMMGLYSGPGAGATPEEDYKLQVMSAIGVAGNDALHRIAPMDGLMPRLFWALPVNGPIEPSAAQLLTRDGGAFASGTPEAFKALTMGEPSTLQPVGPREGAGAGRILVGQDLERQPHNGATFCDRDCPLHHKHRYRPASKALSASDAIDLVRSRYPNISMTTAGRMVDLALEMKRRGLL